MPSDGLPKNLEPLAAGDPATIGPYVLAGRLGSGGMGTVYLGRTAEKSTHVAIKVIRPELAFDEATRARFRDEMENARRVASFCTAKVLDHGTFENRPYMVTEYIAGTALAEHISTHGSLDSSTLHGFALGVAAALAAIHKAGLVHRDLKPANVLLSLSGPRVIDFGIARALNTVTNHTQTGIVMGSPGWMAPEQLLEEKVTTAADIFAWGCLVAFAGNGTHPFGNGDAMTLGKRMLFAEPVIGDLDSPLDRLVARALAKEPERRPTAQELLLELAGGGSDDNDTNDANAMVSHALHESWRPNLPPPGYGPPHQGGHQTLTGMRHPQQAPPPQGGPMPQQPYPAQGRSAPMQQGPPAQHPQSAPQGARPGAPGMPPSPHRTGQFQSPPHHTGQYPAPQRPGPTGSHPQSQPYVPPVPQPPHNPMRPDRRRGRFVVIAAVIGVVLLVAVLSVVTVLASERLDWWDSKDDVPDNQQSQTAPEASTSPDASAGADDPDGLGGEVFSDGVADFATGPMVCENPTGQRIRIEQGARYCVFELTVANRSSRVLEFSPELQSLGQGEFRELRAESPLHDERDQGLWKPILPDSRVEGTVVFSVPNDVEPEWLVLRSTPDASGARVLVQENRPA
ncbi:serine/threonine-protein kinase [Nocardiopsis ansamitocini]|uniref:serine/threonine-protein kinase n=1 Tax=Nocardiopsis ansamitocini TaxID=1670832 RepID=UPI0025561519|nr:protein kinase [Nocardiopsis ansamitocini]